MKVKTLSNIEYKLSAVGLSLPIAAPPMAAYSPVMVQDRTAYLSGQLPREGDRVVVSGMVGRDVSLERAREGVIVSLLRGLAALKAELGSLDRIQRILKLNVYVQSAPDFVEQSAVADAGSDLIFKLFGELGGHARTAIGVSQLPKNAAVELDLVAAIRAANR
jgi:enamine deaminase RidA (YjgF/YER057c/UK114 family)